VSDSTLIVTFMVSDSRYGVPLSQVRELLRLATVTRLPVGSPVIEGIVNVRGQVVPVLDVRKRFRLPENDPHPSQHLIVAQAGSRLVALRVDRVLDIDEADPEDIEEAAAITPRAEYVSGVAKLPDGMVLIHDPATFLHHSEGLELDAALDASSTAHA